MARETQTNVKINRQTRLDALHVYPPGTVVEYPETADSLAGRIGHLFEFDPSQDWYNPCNAFAYSLGEPRGSGRVDGSVFCDVLRDPAGQHVPCRTSHATCQGSKACAHADVDALSAPYSQASRGHIQSRVQLYTSDNQDAQLLENTISYWAALWRNGCRAAPDPYQTKSKVTPESIDKQCWHETWEEQQNECRRGQTSKLTCKGRLVFDHEQAEGRSHIHCEFYDKNGAKDHLLDYGPAAGLYDIDYLRALFNEDQEEILMIEEEAKQCGFDPSSPCTVVMNHTSVRSKCHVHISLANRDHIRSYIAQAQNLSFPFGTGWKGLLHLKNVQDSELLFEDRYIRLAVELPLHELEELSEDEDGGGSHFRLVICMLPQNSRRLKEAQYLQSDIGFKRIQAFQEFELGGKDMKSNISSFIWLVTRANSEWATFSSFNLLPGISHMTDRDRT
ncbi:hypothetical protein PAXINDRAFT_15246 [Paxillus involutus ATCC 200175]|uniref:Uncharacterized protein n=1 Tax=Paxillus involutus ATCC 200175 TaxID=664439 RepID=A0A0C9T8C1_PAXIN|nr:hypothetical protein PAXINDRAFT_15246 [Paxillus involutus ATCC 200175]